MTHVRVSVILRHASQVPQVHVANAVPSARGHQQVTVSASIIKCFYYQVGPFYYQVLIMAPDEGEKGLPVASASGGDAVFAWALFRLCLSTFLVFVAFHATENFVPLLFKSEGSDSLAAVYASTFCFNTVVPTLVRSNPGRLGMIMGFSSMAYALYSLAFAFSPGRAVRLAASALLGAGSTALFVAAGAFLKQISVPSNYGVASGAFWLSINLASVPGSLVGYLLPDAKAQAASVEQTIFGSAAALSALGGLLMLTVACGRGREAGEAGGDGEHTGAPLCTRLAVHLRAMLRAAVSPAGRRILPIFVFLGLASPFRRVQLARQIGPPGQPASLATTGLVYAAQGAPRLWLTSYLGEVG